MKKIYILKACILMLISTAAYSQSMTSSGENSLAFNRALDFFTASIGINTPLYSGSEAVQPRYPVSTGSAFFESTNAMPADLAYDGIRYKDVPAWYDVVNDEVSVLHPKSNLHVVLNPKMLSSFTLSGNLFVHADRSVAGNERLPGNYYRVLHAGKSVLLARHSKQLFEKIQEGRFFTNYTNLQSEFFLQKDGQYYAVKNVAALIDILSDKRQQLKQYNKQYEQDQKSKTKSKETLTQSLVRIIAYYDQISL